MKLQKETSKRKLKRIFKQEIKKENFKQKVHKETSFTISNIYKNFKNNFIITISKKYVGNLKIDLE